MASRQSIYGAKMALTYSCEDAEEPRGKVFEGKIIMDMNELPGKGVLATVTFSAMDETGSALSVKLDDLIAALTDFTMTQDTEDERLTEVE